MSPPGDDDFDLDALKDAVADATPRPDPAVRAAHLRLAQENFDRLQGSRDPSRLTAEAPNAGAWPGVRRMLNAITTRGRLTATTALVACGLLLTPAGQDLWRPAPGVLGGPQTPELVLQPDPAAPPAPEAQTQTQTHAEADDAADAPVVAMEPSPADEAAPEAAPRGRMPEAEAAEESLADVAPPPPAVAPAPQVMQRVAPPGGAAMTTAPQADGDAVAGLVAPAPEMAPPPRPDTEPFANEAPNPVKITVEEPVSTFSIDVDTASWAIVRNSLTRGQLPPRDAVRVEEMVNYFPYDYPAPDADADTPFRPTVTVFETPWNTDTQLVRIGLQGEMPAVAERPPLNLVFLIDTSGSMEDPSKLPLLKQSFRLMLDNLRPEDEVAIVTYAGSAGLALPATPAGERSTILAALDRLAAGGSTNGQGGLEQAYRVAEEMAAEGEVSRVILATDGDFNVGVSEPGGLTEYVERQRDSGTYLSVLGFGRGNLDDAVMQALAQNGNGTAAYIDTLNEAQKVLVDQLTGALFPIAGDVKVQVEWNPAEVAEYRLIGYETRALRREDFNNDAVDAGELGAGHSVTALYEVTPVGSPARLSDPLRYQPEQVAGAEGELGFLRLRWKAPGEDVSRLMETPIGEAVTAPDTEAAFAAAIAGFGQLLRGSDYLGDWGYDEAIALANANRGEDPFGYRTEAVQLMRLAQSLTR
ncbi:vWA domain-containing protein [Wenxinia marina]|uniref:VWFA domain-containing protein n=1 Tax=Wenxinia marina DSM 24838 TaxID=1123501 RepID=A0A0D0PA76_9RHOB|nr:VWA domain-containing protein [Wenxinia marina]KIQ68411.1 Uncharacterized protein Wenmar_03058 [Wenxinia marina DSM 24838]GGL72428.1 hypothetical protein GCM10011392_28780 [Wenxinia marina]